MFNTQTSTATYTVVDIRKTFEGFCADLRMIAKRTDKLSNQLVEDYIHDVLEWAEAKYLNYVDIVLLNQYNTPIIASRYTINEDGSSIQSERAGNNNWQNIPNSKLILIVSFNKKWLDLSESEKSLFKKNHDFKSNWGSSTINNSYSHLSQSSAQLYASKGYELKKENFQ